MLKWVKSLKSNRIFAVSTRDKSKLVNILQNDVDDSKLTTTIKLLVNTSNTSHNYNILSVMRTFTSKIYSLSNFQVYSVVLLTTITMLNIKSPELIHLTTGSLYSLTTVFSFPPPTFTSFLMSKSNLRCWNNDKTKEHCHSRGIYS